jgi:hypothetical protein
MKENFQEICYNFQRCHIPILGIFEQEEKKEGRERLRKRGRKEKGEEHLVS